MDGVTEQDLMISVSFLMGMVFSGIFHWLIFGIALWGVTRFFRGRINDMKRQLTVRGSIDAQEEDIHGGRGV